ncbi:PRC-barrel domain-containing protein [Achromobacter kerstersii]|uniref:PRC-barrel domain-containing protein n=1 Tax=Achromobacter kerstersii TaxID=1353890 RepID=UPI003D0663F6
MPGANVQSPLSAQSVPQSVTEVRVVVAKVDAGYRASKMSGSTVYNSKKEKIGTVDDLILGPPDWVPYAVLSVHQHHGASGKAVHPDPSRHGRHGIFYRPGRGDAQRQARH